MALAEGSVQWIMIDETHKKSQTRTNRQAGSRTGAENRIRHVDLVTEIRVNRQTDSLTVTPSARRTIKRGLQESGVLEMDSFIFLCRVPHHY